MTRKYTVNDFFCGCGGMGLGFKQAGYETLLAWDYDKYAVQSYKHNVDEIAEIKDISQVGPWDVPKADVWTFGFPCQDISIAGKGAGMIKGETRSGLFYAIMELLEYTYREDMPKVIMAENVKNVRKLLPIIEKEYAKVGYKMYAQMYSSQFWGCAQQRERYFIVGVRDDLGIDFKHLEELAEDIPILLDILDMDVDEKFFLSDDKVENIEIEDFDEWERLDKIVRLGNSHPSGKGMNGMIFAFTGLAPTVTTNKGEGHKIVVPSINRVAHLKNQGTTQQHNNRVYSPLGISPTLTAVSDGTHHIKIMVPEATKKGYVIGEIGDAVNIAQLNSKTRRGRLGKEIAQTLLTSCEQVTIDPQKKRVRKLTPNEYGKLQGFPMDDWEQVVSNTQAYKQFGNAVSVPVAKALAEAIIEQVLEVSDGDKQSTAGHGVNKQA